MINILRQVCCGLIKEYKSDEVLYNIYSVYSSFKFEEVLLEANPAN